MSYQLLITTTTTKYNYIEVGYGSYRRGSIGGVASSTTTVSFDTRKEADEAADSLKGDDDVTVKKLYKTTKRGLNE